MYVQRSVDRGYDRKEIGVSWSKYQRLKLLKRMKKYMALYGDQLNKFNRSQTVSKLKTQFKQLLGMEPPEAKSFIKQEEESDFDC